MGVLRSMTLFPMPAHCLNAQRQGNDMSSKGLSSGPPGEGGGGACNGARLAPPPSRGRYRPQAGRGRPKAPAKRRGTEGTRVDPPDQGTMRPPPQGPGKAGIAQHVATDFRACARDGGADQFSKVGRIQAVIGKAYSPRARRQFPRSIGGQRSFGLGAQQ